MAVFVMYIHGSNLIDRWKGLSSLQKLPTADMEPSDIRLVLIFDRTAGLF